MLYKKNKLLYIGNYIDVVYLKSKLDF